MLRALLRFVVVTQAELQQLSFALIVSLTVMLHGCDWII